MALRIYFGIASAAILALCVANYWMELTPAWKDFQRKYYDALSEKLEDPEKAAQVRGTTPKFVQIYNAELGVADRCTICHLGMETPLMDGAANPHKPHPGSLLASHPYQTVGCTLCHQGQGLATTVEDAHGHVPHWDRPLLTGDFIQATCSKCHHDDEVPGAPVLTRGKRLLHERGCVGCHRTGEAADDEKVGPRLSLIGSKVSRPWLQKWLVNPKGYLPEAKMPHYPLDRRGANTLAAYLSTFREKAIDDLPPPKGNYEAGATIYRELQCIVCHVTREDRAGKPVGGTIGPDLRRLANKVNQRWLVAFLRNPHAFYPNTKMPRYHLSDQAVQDLAQFAMEEWVDADLRDAERREPAPPPDTAQVKKQGELLYAELACAGCHDLTGKKTELGAPDLTFIGSKPVHDLDFGGAEVPRTLPDFLYTKLRTPRALASDFRLPLGEEPAVALWKNLQPTALYSGAAALPDGSDSERTGWILARVQEEGHVDRGYQLPEGSAQEQAQWLAEICNRAGLLNPLKMPDFQLDTADAEALTIALMSQSAERISSRRYEVPRKERVVFDPKDDFGQLERRYRCRSCHSIRQSGEALAADLTFEGSRANREWLYHYLKRPYSMRRTITIAMPIFNFPDEDARFMADYMSQVFADSQLGEGWKRGRPSADAARGKTLFDAKGCIACHQVHGKGGDVGPSLTTQVPEFPQGTWVGDKLRGEWIFQWLKNPQSLVPGTLEPNLALTDQEALDLTEYVLSLKNLNYKKTPSPQEKAQPQQKPAAAKSPDR
jgi:mono/diheme cytochrome c family protein